MLSDSKLLASFDAVSEFSSLRVETSEFPVSCEELLKTYRLRSDHLSQFPTRHAKQLHASTQELCSNLEIHKNKHCLIHTLTGSSSHHYHLVVLQNSQVLLGCLKTVSQLDVSDDEWSELWVTNQ